MPSKNLSYSLIFLMTGSVMSQTVSVLVSLVVIHSIIGCLHHDRVIVQCLESFTFIPDNSFDRYHNTTCSAVNQSYFVDLMQHSLDNITCQSQRLQKDKLHTSLDMEGHSTSFLLISHSVGYGRTSSPSHATPARLQMNKFYLA